MARIHTNSLGMKLVYLAGGRFKMGDGGADAPVHEVTLSPFWIGQYEVTNAEYDAFRKLPRVPMSATNSQPVMGLSWYQADNFCRWLSKRDGHHYRLPTEAEWEYAARGGLEQKQYPWGDDDPQGRATFGMPNTTPVGSYAPNGYGLFDMAGNIEEWVGDWYDEHYYAHSPAVNPQGPPNGAFKITRGGGYLALEVRCSVRLDSPPDLTKLPPPDTGDVNIPGFRVVMDNDQKVTSASHVVAVHARPQPAQPNATETDPMQPYPTQQAATAAAMRWGAMTPQEQQAEIQHFKQQIMRKDLVQAGFKDRTLQDTILRFVADQETSRAAVRLAAQKLAAALHPDGKSTVDAATMETYVNDYLAAGDQAKALREAAATALDGKINYSKNPRLKGWLLLHGLIGESAWLTEDAIALGGFDLFSIFQGDQANAAPPAAAVDPHPK